jgi:hypothetical protein
MPDFVKCLRDIKECSGVEFLVFEGFVNPVNDVMRLFDGGVSPPEAELERGYKFVVRDEWKEPFEEQLLKEFGYNGQENDWSAGWLSVGRFPWRKDEDDLCNFLLGREVV